MTIAKSYTPANYPVNGAGPYAFEWELLSSSAVEVYLDDVLVPFTQYTVTLYGNAPVYTGGFITFQNPPTGTQIEIRRNTDDKQQVDYTDYGPFSAAEHEVSLDKLTLLAQEAKTVGGDGGGGGGFFLPLAGGRMDAGAAIEWQAPGLPDVGRQVFQNFLGVPSFQWGPASGFGPIGYLWNVGGGAVMGYSVQGVLALEGRPDFATLPDNAVALKSDVLTGGGQFVPLAGGTWDQGALMVYPNDPTATDSSDAEFGYVNFFGINALRVQAVTPNTPLGIGYLFLTDQQNVETPFIVGSKSDGWRVRFQKFDDIDAIVTRDYLETNTIEEAPEDGESYARQNATWVTLATALDFLPLAGGTMDPDAVVEYGVSGGGFAGLFSFTDILGLGTFWLRPSATPGTDIGFLLTTGLGAGAPQLGGNSTDGFEITNQSFNAPEAILTLGEAESRFLVDAPIDGNEYVRFNGAWAVNSGGSGGEVNTNSNAGAGAGLVLPKVGADTPIKSLVQGTNITITEQADTVTISASGSVSVNWGGINGTLSDQTDLQAALDAKADLAGGNTFTGNQTFNGQVTVGGGLSGGLIVTGSGAGYSIDASAIILARGGFNAFNQKVVAVANGTTNTDAVNLGQLNSGLAGKANTSHTHTIAQVSGLQAALDGKAALSHTHVIGDVSGLQTALNSKTERSANETISGVWTFSSGFSASFGVTLGGGALMGNTRIQGLAAGTNTTDAVNLGQLNAKPSKSVNETITGIWTFSSGFAATSGVNLSGGILMGTARIQGLGNPINPQDAATRAWVEANFAPL